MRANGNGHGHKRPVPRVALTLQESADSLGMSIDSFRRHVRPHVRVIHRGKLVLFPLTELSEWAESSAELELEVQR